MASPDEAFRRDLADAGDFSPPTLDEWRALAERSLRGNPLDSLSTEIDEGLVGKPLYTGHDLEGLSSWAFGRHGAAQAGWQACQRSHHPHPAAAAREIAADQECGVHSAWVVFDRSARLATPLDEVERHPAGRDGVLVFDTSGVSELVAGSHPIHSPLVLGGGGNAVATAGAVLAVCLHEDRSAADLAGRLGVDPLAALAADGELPYGLERSLALLPDVVGWCERHAPRVSALTVSSLPYGAAGASAVQELASSLATAVCYLRAITSRGVVLGAACRHLGFVITVGRDLFLGIAKLRALRWMWARVVEASGGSPEHLRTTIHAVTSPRTVTLRDPWVNAIRATVESFAAVVGGADILTVLPFDVAAGPSDPTARRLAALTHAILREESQLHRVADAAAGSYTVERIGHELAEAAWSRFQEIESAGGMAAVLADGSLAREIGERSEARRRAVADGRERITGVTSHPNPGESLLRRPPVDTAELVARARTRLEGRRPPTRELSDLETAARTAGGDGSVLSAAIAACAAGASLADVAEALRGDGAATRIAPLPAARDSEPFERLDPAPREQP